MHYLVFDNDLYNELYACITLLPTLANFKYNCKTKESKICGLNGWRELGVLPGQMESVHI